MWILPDAVAFPLVSLKDCPCPPSPRSPRSTPTCGPGATTSTRIPETAFEETGHQRVRRRQAALVRPRRAHGAGRHRRGRRAAQRHGHDGRRPARRHGRAPHPREVRRRARVAQRGQDARVRPRRPHDDAAGRRARAGAAPQLRRHRVLHLPARRGERGRRPRDGAGGPVRPLPDEGRVRHAQLAGAAGRPHRAARGPADGRVRHLRDRRDRPRRATRRCRTWAATRCRSPRT